jgi:hypothetical protein
MARRIQRKGPSGKKAAAEKLIKELQDAKKSEDVPAGLDALIDSIQNASSDESEDSSALAIIPKVDDTEEELVSEEVDERILTLLGQQDVNDIDYGTYKTLLKEKMMAARMADSKIPTEETELLTDEYKRVKTKTGRFTVKKKKVNKDSFFNAASDIATSPGKNLKALPPGLDKKVEEGLEEVEDEVGEEKIDETMEFIKNVLAPSLTTIEKNLEGILETLSKQLQLEKKQATKADKDKQKTKRTAREAVLEEGKSSKIKGMAEKIMKPAMGIFDFIKNFVIQTLMGGAFVWLLKFLQDPAGNFDKMWKGLINGIIGLLNSLITLIYDNVIMPINQALNAINTAIGDMEKQINNALSIFGGGGITLPRIPLIPLMQIQPIPLAGQPPNQGGPVTFTAPTMDGGGKVEGNTGIQITGAGPDTQLVALSPGEVVMSNKAGDMYGRDNLLAANAAAGGTNRPKMGKVQMASGGGQIMAMQGGGIVEHLHGEPGRRGYRADHGTASNAHDHYAFSSENLRISVQNALAAGESPSGRKYEIGSTTKGKHADTSYHYAGKAFDIPWSQFGSGAINSRDFQQSRQLQKDVNALVARFGGTSSGTQRSDDTKDMRGPAKVANTKSSPMQINIPAGAGDTQINVVLVPAGQGKNGQSLSNSGANQSKVPGFSAVDGNNFEMMVVKSIYNIVG